MPFEERLPGRIVMEQVDERTHRTLALLGGVTVTGLAVAVVCLPLSLILGDPIVPAIGGLALALVGGALTYGKRLLRD